MVCMKEEATKMKWVLVSIPAQAHRNIKAKAARAGMHLRDYVAKLLSKHGSK